MMVFEISSQTNVILLPADDWSLTNTSPDVYIKMIGSVGLPVEMRWKTKFRTDSAVMFDRVTLLCKFIT